MSMGWPAVITAREKRTVNSVGGRGFRLFAWVRDIPKLRHDTSWLLFGLLRPAAH